MAREDPHPALRRVLDGDEALHIVDGVRSRKHNWARSARGPRPNAEE
jgi:hypothetical protein